MSDSNIEKKPRAKTPKKPSKADRNPKQAASKPSASTKRKPAAPPAFDEPARSRAPILGWIPLFTKKPKLEVKYGEAARDARREHETRPLTFWSLMIRLLPIWTLVIMILILEPTLPLKAVGAAVNWVRQQAPQRPTYDPIEPVYIVENPNPNTAATTQSELPVPNWPLDISPFFTPEVQYWEGRIGTWSTTYRIKPNMIATVMQIESCGNPQIISPSGAAGLFQVLPDHFRAGENSADPDLNAERGLTYLGEMLATANGDVGRAFAAYNGGPSMLYTSPADWPEQTQNYQYWASGIYEDAELGIDQSPTLEDWLDAGGRELCAQAASVLGLP